MLFLYREEIHQSVTLLLRHREDTGYNNVWFWGLNCPFHLTVYLTHNPDGWSESERRFQEISTRRTLVLLSRIQNEIRLRHLTVS